jgi:hypothetical protein
MAKQLAEQSIRLIIPVGQRSVLNKVILPIIEQIVPRSFPNLSPNI